MKQVLVTFILLTTLLTLSYGQAVKEIKTDTTFLEWDVIPDDWTGADDSIWYEVRTVTYTNGREETIREAVGDTTTAVNYLTNRTVDIDRQLAQAAAIAIQRPAVIRAGRVSDKALLGIGIGSVYSGIDTLFWREYLNGARAFPFIQNYNVNELGTDRAATMRRMANGNIRLSFNGNNYVCIILSDTWLRVQGYPAAGQNIDLFRTGPKRWESLGGLNQGNKIIPTIVLRKTN